MRAFTLGSLVDTKASIYVWLPTYVESASCILRAHVACFLDLLACIRVTLRSYRTQGSRNVLVPRTRDDALHQRRATSTIAVSTRSWTSAWYGGLACSGFAIHAAIDRGASLTPTSLLAVLDVHTYTHTYLHTYIYTHTRSLNRDCSSL